MMAEAEEAGADLRGAELGPYKIVRRLGAGGMAETFEAVRSGPNEFTQRVCLKLALPFLREQRQFVRLFEREAKLAAQLRHSNIVGVLDYGEVDEILYIALELVDGVDLLTLLAAQGRLPFENVALLAVELAKGLEHAHNLPPSSGPEESSPRLHGVLHRDLSPSNVMLSRQGEVMLTDFGLAKAMSASSQHEVEPTIKLPDGRVKGKVPYMSPEQLRNESLDGRADLFSLGVLLFESQTGTCPFDGGNDPRTIMQILRGEHIPLAELAPGAPEGFCEIVDSLLDPDRERRPKSASELIRQLDEFAPSPEAQRHLGVMVAQLHGDSLRGGELDPAGASESTFVRRGDALESGVTVKAGSAPASGRETSQRRRGLHVSVPAALTFVVALLAGLYLLATRSG